MSKFKIGQKVKIINSYPYSNFTGVIIDISPFDYSFYRIHLDEKFHKIFEKYTFMFDLLIHEKDLVLANGNLMANE